MTIISKSIEINAPVSEVFTYFARPEHMADQFPESMNLNVIPIEVKNGFGVGTIFRINGDYGMPMGPLGELMNKVKIKKIAERGMENGLYRVKALLEGTGSIPVYITLEAYRKILKEKERYNCSVSDAIVRLVKEHQTAKVSR